MDNNQLNEKIKILQDEVNSLTAEVAKFSAGNKAAGVRARNTLQRAKMSCQEIRQEILDVTKAREANEAKAGADGKVSAPATNGTAPKGDAAKPVGAKA